MTPLRLSRATDAAKRLESIECVEISHVEEHDGKNYFAIQLFLHHEKNRIPMNRSRRILRYKPTSSQPDLVIRRRFSDFARLRSQIWELVHRPHPDYCLFCDGFVVLFAFHLAKPTVVTSLLCPTPKMRAQLLNRFIVNLLAEVRLNRPRCRLTCQAHQELYVVLDDFFFKEKDTDARSSDWSVPVESF
ncbi:hypothetical protein P43SY_004447 [Pythium insidiosum]|uniref:PX domain-containing protein n=1 Tax=Pythium insidiosum TaxID=114742 RepID=A0AAD5M952_PYTIN|nr:hypothetical protein P43SY_004447 [Pythium insidiosum]KAJ0407794.1 hypothetical protein ATCC90586_006270 [Pythium insidiosum]